MARRFFIADRNEFDVLLGQTLTKRHMVEFKYDSEESRTLKQQASSPTKFYEDVMQTVDFFWGANMARFPFEQPRIRDPHGCWVNHLSEEHSITDKANLARGLQGFARHPRTLVLDATSLQSIDGGKCWCSNLPRTTYCEELECFQRQPCALHSPTGKETWILKPARAACGRGIQLMDGSELRCTSDRACASVIHSLLQHGVPYVLQQYISRPLLWRDELSPPSSAQGRKFDLRAYVLVFPQISNASGEVVSPMRAFFHPGYARICASYYSQPLSSSSCSSASSTLSSHVTNYHIQSQHSRFDASQDTVDGLSIRASWEAFEALLAGQHVNPQKVAEEMRQVTGKALSRFRHAFKQSEGFINEFALFGVDMLLDESYHVWLLEFTRCPALRLFPEFLRKIHTRLLDSLVDILWPGTGEGTNSPSSFVPIPLE